MVKVMFVESVRKGKETISLNKEELKNLPKEVILAYSIQYINVARELKRIFESKENGIKVKQFIQVLGCSKISSKDNLPIILIGSGKFHALNLALQNKDVYIYNIDKGCVENVNEVHKGEIERLRLNKKNNINRFLHSESIGIIVSTKPGQNKVKEAEELKKSINKKYPEKEVFIFISNNINLSELENFQIDVWINTSCPGLVNDSDKIINYDDINYFLEAK
jgi:2-(3-amino-3-carboxypropyl)histidine synthase